jgi:flagellar biosynthesis/type III secretory pathway protein FliH
MWLTTWITMWLTTTITSVDYHVEGMGDSKTPSRKRYEERNPTVSFRISKQRKEDFDEMVEGLETTKKEWFETIIEEREQTYSQVFKQGFTKGRRQGYDDGYNEGYDDGSVDAAPVVPCVECGEALRLDGEDGRQQLWDVIESMRGMSAPTQDTMELVADLIHSECKS